VAVDDMGTVTTGSETLIDPLENDVDPTGGVLVVNSVSVPKDSGLKATVVGHHLIKVEAEPNAEVGEEPVALTYEDRKSVVEFRRVLCRSWSPSTTWARSPPAPRPSSIPWRTTSIPPAVCWWSTRSRFPRTAGSRPRSSATT